VWCKRSLAVILGRVRRCVGMKHRLVSLWAMRGTCYEKRQSTWQVSTWAVHVLIIDELGGLALVVDRQQWHGCLLMGCTGIALCPDPTCSLAGGSEGVADVPRWPSTLRVSPSLSYATL
jgi:hypothetical protein